MAQAGTDKPTVSAVSQELLLSLAEQLKVPLLQIAGQAELAHLTGNSDQLSEIQTTASSALKLIDHYTVGVQLAQQSAYELALEPVSVPAVLYDTNAELLPLAKAYGVKLDLDVTGKFTPVMAHRRALQSALVSLGYALIEALPANQSQLHLQLSVHHCRHGIVAGMYCDTPAISAQTLRQGRELYGRARQPLTQLSPSSGAGIFVADAILQAMQSQLTVSRHRNLRGLAAILQPSPQLQLV